MSTSSQDLFAGVLPFVVTADAKSFRDAAKQLGVTASAVSKAISKLEADLGVRLLHRTSRSVTLTTEGETFLARCRDAVEQVRAARELVAQAQRAPRGVLRVSVSLALGRLVMGNIPRLLARHPALSVHMVLTDRFVQFSDENVDVAVRIGAVEDSTSVARRLRALRWLTVASPAYLAKHGTPEAPRDLARHNCLKFILPSGVAQEWVFAGDEAARAPRVAGNLTADQGESLIAAAVAGLGIVQALDFMVATELSKGELVEVLSANAGGGPPLTVVCAPGRHGSPKVRAFVAFMVETMGPPSGGPPRALSRAAQAGRGSERRITEPR